MGPNKSVNRGIRNIQGHQIQIVELGWASGHVAFEVILLGNEEELLTEGDFLLAMPTDRELSDLLDSHLARKFTLN